MRAIDEAGDFDPDLSRISLDEDRNNNGADEEWAEIVIRLKPNSAGTLTIPSFAINDKTTQAIDIEVTDASTQAKREFNKDLYLKIEIGQDPVVVDEQFEVAVRLYYTINGIRNPQFSEMLLPNSVSQTIESPRQYEEQIEGVRYGVYEKRYLLTTPQSGTIEIPDIFFTGEVEESGSLREISAFVEGTTIVVGEA